MQERAFGLTLLTIRHQIKIQPHIDAKSLHTRLLYAFVIVVRDISNQVQTRDKFKQDIHMNIIEITTGQGLCHSQTKQTNHRLQFNYLIQRRHNLLRLPIVRAPRNT